MDCPLFPSAVYSLSTAILAQYAASHAHPFGWLTSSTGTVFPEIGRAHV